MRFNTVHEITDPLCRFYTQPAVGDLLVRLMGRFSPRRIVDLGAGDGSLSAAASIRWRRAEIVTVDLDEGCTRALERQLSSLRPKRHVHVKLDALEANLPAKRPTENELSDFSLLWHERCEKQSMGHKMWTEITRRKYEREGQRYASDVTDAEWALIEPHMPAAKPLGRPREIELRAVLDAILYIARTGCQWRMLPKDFPPFTTVQGYFYDWRDNGLFEKINFELLLQAREAAGREPSPSAGVIDSQSVKTTESGGPRGYDAAKKVKGRKRHIVTDTSGLLVGAEVHPADVQDRDGAGLVIEAIHQLFPWLRHLFADSVHNGPNLRDALAKFGNWTIEIVKRAADAAGFQLLPRRWVVERTFAWLNRNRRLAKDFEATIASAKA